MVLKSKYQGIATSAGRRKKGKGASEEEGLEKLGKLEIRGTTESDPAVTSALQQSNLPAGAKVTGESEGPARFRSDL